MYIIMYEDCYSGCVPRHLVVAGSVSLSLLRRRKWRSAPLAVGFTAADAVAYSLRRGRSSHWSLVSCMWICMLQHTVPGQSFGQTWGFFGKGFGVGGLLVSISFITLIFAEWVGFRTVRLSFSENQVQQLFFLLLPMWVAYLCIIATYCVLLLYPLLVE